MKGNQLQLTPAQAAYLQTLLPFRHSLQPNCPQGKRVRAAKKMDESFTNDFNLCDKKVQTKDIRVPSSAKKIDEEPNVPQDKTVSPKEVQHSEKVDVQRQEQKQGLLEKRLSSFVVELKKLFCSFPFRMPDAQVLPKKVEVVKQPMDLYTMNLKIKSHLYPSQNQFDRDVRLIIANSYAFHPPNTVYYSLTKQFQNCYEKLWNDFRKNPQGFGQPQIPKQIKEPEYIQNTREVQVTPKKKLAAKQKKESSMKKKKQTQEFLAQKEQIQLKIKTSSTIKQEAPELPFKAREQLLHQIHSLNQDGIKALIQITHGPSHLQAEWQQLQFDLRELPQSKLRKIQQYLSQVGRQ